MKKIYMGFNTSGNNQTSGRTTNAVLLGKLRNTPGSISRKFKYCNNNSSSLEQTLQCVFDIPSIPSIPSEDTSGKYQIAVGDNAFAISKDYGITWEQKPNFAGIGLRSVAISQDGQFILTGGRGTPLYRSTNGGDTFNIVPDTSGFNWNEIKMSKSGQYQTATGPSHSVYVSNDYGETFNIVPLLINGAYFSTYLSMSDNGQYQTITDTNNAYIFVSSNYGAIFNQIDGSIFSNGVSSSAMSANGQIQMAVDQYWRVFKSINYAQNWQQVADLSGQGVTELYFISVSSSAQYQLIPSPAPPTGNFLFVSNDFGENWSTNVNIDGIPQNISPFVYKTWFLCQVSSSGKYQTVTDSYDGNIGNIYTSSDFGKNFYKRISAGEEAWYSIFMS